MKYLLLLALLCTVQSIHAQVAVVDAGSNVKLSEQTILQNAIKGYNYLMAKLQNSTLAEATKTASDVNEQLSLLDAALDVADQFEQSQVVKDFFVKQTTIIGKINLVNGKLYNSSFVIHPSMRQAILKLLNESYTGTIKSLTVISTGFVRKQLNLSERMVFYKEADTYLSDSMDKVQQASVIISKAESDNVHLQNKQSFIKSIF